MQEKPTFIYNPYYDLLSPVIKLSPGERKKFLITQLVKGSVSETYKILEKEKLDGKMINIKKYWNLIGFWFTLPAFLWVEYVRIGYDEYDEYVTMIKLTGEWMSLVVAGKFPPLAAFANFDSLCCQSRCAHARAPHSEPHASSVPSRRYMDVCMLDYWLICSFPKYCFFATDLRSLRFKWLRTPLAIPARPCKPTLEL